MDRIRDLLARPDLNDFLLAWGLRLAAAAAVLLIGLWLSRLVSRGVARLLGHRMDRTLAEFLGTVLNALLIVAVIIAALDHLGVNTASLLAILATAGLAVGLALKDSLSNFAAGVMLIGLRPFQAGHFVNLGGTMGTVEQIRLFHTVLISPDGQEIILPNGGILRGTITNFSCRPTRRVDLAIGISYDDDIRRAREVILGVVGADERVLPDPEPEVLVTTLGESSVNLAVRCWTQTPDWWATRCALIERIKLALDEAAITIPYPQRDVHLKQPA